MKPGRELAYDVLKGIAVITMVITHVIAFFHDFTNPTLNTFADIGATVSFTTFLFCIGAVLPYSVLREGKKIDSKPYIIRILLILGAYYLIAGIAFFRDLRHETLQTLLKIVFFVRIPQFAEFLLTFSVLGLLTLALNRQLRQIKDKLYYVVGLSAILYLVGFILWSFDWGFLPIYLRQIPGILWGYRDWHTFPILQYTPIFLMGIYTGNIIRNNAEETKESVLKNFRFVNSYLVINILLTFLWIAISVVFTQNLSSVDKVFLFSRDRFPPSPKFLMIGVSVVLSLLSIYFGALYLKRDTLAKKVLSKGRVVMDVLGFMGENVFLYFFWHTIVLYLISERVFISIDFWWQSLLLSGIVLLICTALVYSTQILLMFFRFVLSLGSKNR